MALTKLICFEAWDEAGMPFSPSLFPKVWRRPFSRGCGCLCDSLMFHFDCWDYVSGMMLWHCCTVFVRYLLGCGVDGMTSGFRNVGCSYS